ncbi:DUF4352 domain-containing protein [Candidatus Saccharibacteria bacterium]|nr:DUF4352 domain-containing protein [Candidatus Saccharibacteria bacterium]MCA9328312.1 DUF4352 domain-containing protein [Candidatus Saccharibacteria bacterium]
MKRFERYINYFVALIAVGVLSTATALLLTHKEQEKVAVTPSNTSQTANAVTDTGLLGESDSRESAVVTGRIINTDQTDSGNTRFTLDISVQNSTGSRIEFSPPIELFARDKTGKVYQLESSPDTTLFGGPLEAGESTEGNVFFVLDGTVSSSDISFFYQPNATHNTVEIKLY